MPKPRLYIFIGYPGAGKTTIARIIHEKTGAEHLWADHVRQEMFKKPTHSLSESIQLYDHLNKVTAELLSKGTSVIYDTNFNFLSDRMHMRQIANEQNAESMVIWVTTPRDIAKQRAVDVADGAMHRVLGSMTPTEFDTIADKLETPDTNEKVIKIDGTNLDEADLLRQLGL